MRGGIYRRGLRRAGCRAGLRHPLPGRVLPRPHSQYTGEVIERLKRTPEERAWLCGGTGFQVKADFADCLHSFGAGDVAGDENGVVVEVGLAQASVEVPYLVSRSFAAFPLLVAGVIALIYISDSLIWENEEGWRAYYSSRCLWQRLHSRGIGGRMSPLCCRHSFESQIERPLNI